MQGSNEREQRRIQVSHDPPHHPIFQWAKRLYRVMLPTLAPTFDGKRGVPSSEVTAIMFDLLDLKFDDILLEIGTGSGFQTGVWASTCTVHSIELEPWIDPTQVTGDYIFLHSGDGRIGLPEFAPFTAIVATCGIETIPKEWTEQLGENGKLVVPIGDSKSQRLTLFRKENGELVPVRIGAYTRFQMLREKPKAIPPKYQPARSEL